jgi:two-component system LytT family response regulator
MSASNFSIHPTPDRLRFLPTEPPLPEQVLTVLRGSVHLSVSDIIRLEAERNYTRFVLVDGRKILTSKNLSFYELLLPESFVRVHKSCIINPCLIIQKNKTHIRMSDGAEVEVSRRKRRMTESVIG